MALPRDPIIQAAKARVDQTKQELDSLLKSKKEGKRISSQQLKVAVGQYEAAVKALENLLGNPYGPNRGGSSVGDPHFLGFDGQNYDVMPEGSAIVFSAFTPPSQQRRFGFIKPEPHFCVTGIHSSLLESRNQRGNNEPTWTIAVFIKIFENTLFYDRDQNLLLNGMVTNPFGVFTSPCEEATPGYYWLSEEGTELEVWHPVFGRVVVHNSCNHNLNLTFSVPEEVLKNSTIEGMMVGKRTKDPKDAETKRTNPTISAMADNLPTTTKVITEQGHQLVDGGRTDNLQSSQFEGKMAYAMYKAPQASKSSDYQPRASIGMSETKVLETNQRYVDPRKLNEMKAKNPHLSEKMIRDLLFDYQYTSPEIREQVLESNIISLEKQQQIFEQDRCSNFGRTKCVEAVQAYYIQTPSTSQASSSLELPRNLREDPKQPRSYHK